MCHSRHDWHHSATVTHGALYPIGTLLFREIFPVFQQWLLNHPKLGPLAQRLNKKQGLTRREKIHSLLLIWVSMLSVLFFVAYGTHWQYAILSLLLFETWFILRFKTYQQAEKKRL